MWGILPYRFSISQVSINATYVSSTMRYLAQRNAPVEESTRTYIRGILTTSKNVRDKRASCREKHSVTVVLHASICRYLFNFSIGKHRHAANLFRYLTASSLPYQSTPISTRSPVVIVFATANDVDFRCCIELQLRVNNFYRLNIRFFMRSIQAKNLVWFFRRLANF